MDMMEGKKRIGLILFLFIHECFQLNVSIIPTHITYKQGDKDVKINCSASEPITYCQFKEANLPFVDLNNGNQSKVKRTYTTYFYEGRGLHSGDCGVKIQWEHKPEPYWYEEVGCRVRTADSRWKYASMSLQVSTQEELTLKQNVTELVVLPGKNASLIVEASTPSNLKNCKVSPPWMGGRSINIPSGTPMCPYNKYCYKLSEIKTKECEITFLNVQTNNSGLYWFDVSANDEEGMTFIRLTVAKPPTDPILTQNLTKFDNGSTEIRASCTVRGSRPVASITWYLGSDVIRKDDKNDVPEEEWTWPHEDQSITQLLNMMIDKEDESKSLWCSVDHIALEAPIISQKLRLIEEPESTVKNEQIIYGLVIVLIVGVSGSVFYCWWRGHCFLGQHRLSPFQATVRYKKSLLSGRLPMTLPQFNVQESTHSQYNQPLNYDQTYAAAVQGEYAEICEAMAEKCLAEQRLQMTRIQNDQVHSEAVNEYAEVNKAVAKECPAEDSFQATNAYEEINLQRNSMYEQYNTLEFT